MKEESLGAIEAELRDRYDAAIASSA